MGRRGRGYRKFFTRPPKYGRHYKAQNSGRLRWVSPSSAAQDLPTAPCCNYTEASEACTPAKVTKDVRVQLVDCIVTHPQLCMVDHKKPIRVLSLFDGIATGLYALKKLGVKVDVYYSCEIDEAAIQLQKFRYNGEITLLGCVTKLTPEVLESLGNIDLLIGGPPCDDLSRVNPLRKKLDGVGSSAKFILTFVEIMDILKQISERNGTAFFWMMENTSHTDKHVPGEISKLLKCEPLELCASYFTPMRRKRLYWGNFFQAVEKPSPAEKSRQNLQALLRPYRTAAVKILPTLTTTLHSEYTGKTKRRAVLEDGEESNLYITEREVAFGFPENHTDGPNLTLTDRRRLLGRAWSVHVIMHIFQPLTKIFQSVTA